MSNILIYVLDAIAKAYPWEEQNSTQGSQNTH